MNSEAIVSFEANVHDHPRQLGDSSSPPIASFSGQAVPYLSSTIDAFIVVLFSLAAAIFYEMAAGNRVPDIKPELAVGLLASLFYVIGISRKGFYDLAKIATPRVEVTEILVNWFITGLLLALVAFLLKVGHAFSRGSFIIFYFTTPIALLGMRKLAKVALAEGISTGMIGRRDVLLVGTPDEMLAVRPRDLLSICGAPDVSAFALSGDKNIELRNSADTDTLKIVANFVRRHNCRQILLALPWTDTDRIELIKDQIKSLPVAARLLPDTNIQSLTNFPQSSRDRAFSIELQSAPLTGGQRFVKRGLDILISSMALLFFLPIMIVTAIAIKLESSGPIIFRQNRRGFNGQEFVIFKFRTMTVQENGQTVLQATRDDSRVTNLGRLLRSSSIDELPQLFNVLRGDMSVVGPRPHALAHDNYFESVLSEYAFRHHVKPGITGWAQCNGARGPTPSIEHISERVRLDLWYINHWSIWLDLQILIRTAFEVLKKRNAY
jgi:undecaprenyl-phosphate galactose phosphotransferase/putative colanic acid biosynthesis UDP-glucose lipid carrier transferase